MAINLLNIIPHSVSRDLSGYITYIYGQPKTGKTTLATQMPGALLLAFEKGYNALPGVMAQDITSWGEMRQVYKQLKNPAVKEVYKAVIVDTIDIAADMCSKYICNQNDIDSLGDLGYGKGWTAFKEEFSEIFRGLTQLGYAVFFIGHEKEATITEGDKTRIVVRPALSASTRQIITSMADIYGYAHQTATSDMSVLTLRSADDSISCGGRFKYIKNEFPMSYDALIHEIQVAIDKEAAENNGKYVTDEKEAVAVKTEYDYDALIQEFNEIASQIMKQSSANAPKITAVVDKYLNGKKVSETNPAQAEMIYLIILDLKELL